MFRDKTILITGATGLIGSNLVNKLMELECANVIVLARNEKKVRNIFGKYIKNPNFEYIIQDIIEPIKINDKKIDYIFHAAGPMERALVLNKPVDVIKPNIYGIINCLEFLKKQGSGRLIVFSSVTIYANLKNEDITVREDDSNVTEFLDSNNACYSQSKRISEVIAHSYNKQYNVDIVIGRLSTVYGPSYRIPKTAFYEFIIKAIKGEDITINNSDNPKRDTIYIDDAIRGLLMIAKYGKSNEVYNISSNCEGNNFLAIDEIAEIIADSVRKINDTSINVNFKISEQNNYRKPGIILDNNKLKGLNWSINIDFYTGIKETINFYFKNRELLENSNL